MQTEQMIIYYIMEAGLGVGWVGAGGNTEIFTKMRLFCLQKNRRIKKCIFTCRAGNIIEWGNFLMVAGKRGAGNFSGG